MKSPYYVTAVIIFEVNDVHALVKSQRIIKKIPGIKDWVQKSITDKDGKDCLNSFVKAKDYN